MKHLSESLLFLNVMIKNAHNKSSQTDTVCDIKNTTAEELRSNYEVQVLKAQLT